MSMASTSSVTWGKLKHGELKNCYFEVSAARAEAILLRADINVGQFMVRPNDISQEVRSGALSVRVASEYNGVSRVEHFEILVNDRNMAYLRGEEQIAFLQLEDLIEYYKEEPLPTAGDTLLTEPIRRDQETPPDINEIAVPKQKVIKSNKIGEGAFGEVFVGKYGKIQVAIKQLQREESESRNYSYQFQGEATPFEKEAAILASMNHENIVRIIGVATEDQPFWIITEFMNKGGLDGFLRNDKDVETLTVEEVYRILHCICDGMIYLEHRNVVHCDLRTSNVLVHSGGKDKALEVKVADFGLTKVLSAGQEFTSEDEEGPFPVRWTPLEAMAGHFSSKSDVWSFGCLIFEIVSLGLPPYPSIRNNGEVVERLKAGKSISLQECLTNRRPVGRGAGANPRGVDTYDHDTNKPIYHLCSNELYNQVIAPCFKTLPQERPNFVAVKNNLYIAQYDN